MTDEYLEQIAFLTQFRQDVLAHHKGDRDPGLRTRINKGLPRARELLSLTGALKTVTLSPPPAVGGLMVRNADPLNFVLGDYYGMSLAPTVSDMVEEAIGTLETPEFRKRQAASAAAPHKRTSLATTATVKEPELPAEITLKWLATHVPIRFWFWLFGLLVAALAAGAKWGHLLKL